MSRAITDAFAATPDEASDPSGGGSDRAAWPAESDRELLHGCQRGDTRAWDALVARYERLIYSVAVRNGLSREDAADVTQATFIALLDSMTRLRDDERLPFWLMTVARRQSWRLRRRRDHEVPWRDPGDVADDPIADWERGAVVHEALQQLGAPCRDLLLALYFDPARPSYAQVAERLGRAVGCLGPMRARCLGRLRTLLGEDVDA